MSATTGLPRKTAAGATVLVFTLAAGLVAVRGMADHLLRQAKSGMAVQRACVLMPTNPACWKALAHSLEQEGRDGAAAWRVALSLNSRDPEALVAAAAGLEHRGHVQEAETLLARAVRFNATWTTRWSLASYYLRQGRKEEFWREARLAFERWHGNQNAALRECLSAGGDTPFLLASVFPADLGLHRSLLEFLIERREYGGLEQAAFSVLLLAGGAPNGETRELLLRAVEELARRGDPRAALRVWNSMCQRRLLPNQPTREDSPLFNSELNEPFAARGFDWQILPVDGVTYAARRGQGLRFTLHGNQPDDVILLQQWVYLDGGKAWELHFEAATPGIARGESGLCWKILDGETGLAYGGGEQAFSSDDWTENRIRLAGPPAPRLVRVVLAAGRPPRATRMQGDVQVRNVRLRSPS